MKGFFYYIWCINYCSMLRFLFTTAMASIWFFGAYAQNQDLSIQLVQPRDFFVSGVQFTFEVQFNNAGPSTIPSGDTILYQATFNGQPLMEMGQPVSYRHVLNSDLTPSDSINVSRQLTIIGGRIGQVVVCAEILEHRGSAAGNEADSTNWQNCTNVNYTDNASTGSFRVMQTINHSRINNNFLTVDVEGVPMTNNKIDIRLCNIAGKILIQANAQPQNNHLQEQFSLPPLSPGVYLLHISNHRDMQTTKN